MGELVHDLSAFDNYRLSKADLENADTCWRAIQKTLVGEFIVREGFHQFFEAGGVRDLFLADLNDAETSQQSSVWMEMLDADITKLEKLESLEEVAFAIIFTPIYGTDDRRRKLILSVADVEYWGWMAQAFLAPPMPQVKRPWPWWYRPWKKPDGSRFMPNLFVLFGVEV